MARLFVALIPPGVVQAEVAGLAADLPEIYGTNAEQVHLTLRFIGDADRSKREAFVTALRRVAVEPFVLPVGGVGVFPPRGPARVLWVGVGAGHPRLHQLRSRVDDALLSVDPAIDVERFHPHLTVGRIAEAYAPKPLARFLEQHQCFEAPPFRVTEFHLLSSEPTANGASGYRAVETFRLSETG